MFISFSINVLTFHTILTPLEEFKARYFSIASKSKQINNIVCSQGVVKFFAIIIESGSAEKAEALPYMMVRYQFRTTTSKSINSKSIDIF